MKILHLPTSTAGYAWGIGSYQKSLGHQVDILYRDKNIYGYQSTISIYKHRLSFIRTLILSVLYVFRLRKKYDLYHFNFGTTLLDFYFLGMPVLDLPFYQGNKIITFNGTDARGWTYPIYKDHPSRILDEAYRKQKGIGLKRRFYPKKFRKIEKYADQIFAVNPDLLRFLPAKSTFLPYFISHWDTIPKIPYEVSDRIRIIHSPTSRDLKGSQFIIEAVNRLQKKYSNIEFVLVENMAHKAAMKLYESADLIIDQVLIGWYGGFAVEVMKMGKPVGVFIREEDLQFIPNSMANDLRDSIININTSNIFEVLEKYVLQPKYLEEKSRKAYAYVNKWHDPKYIHSLVLDQYLETDKQTNIPSHQINMDSE